MPHTQPPLVNDEQRVIHTERSRRERSRRAPHYSLNPYPPSLTRPHRKLRSLSPYGASLTKSPSRNSLRAVTYEKDGGWGSASHSPLTTSHFLLTPVCPAVTDTPSCNSFRPNTYNFTRPQVLYAQQLHKSGGGGCPEYLSGYLRSRAARSTTAPEPSIVGHASVPSATMPPLSAQNGGS
jgi:hypothetical protein